MKKIVKRILVFIGINLCLYLIAVVVLINWPIPQKVPAKNYDYTSIDTIAVKTYPHQEEWISMRDGAALFSRRYAANCKTVLLLLHGSGSESRYLQSLAGRLAQEDLATVLTPDLRGHGRNLLLHSDIDHIGQLEEDLEDFLFYAQHELQAEKIVLAGHSSGGGLVLRYLASAKHPQVDQAILLAPYLGHDAPTVKQNSGGWVSVGVKRWVGLAMLNGIGVTAYNDKPVLFFNRPKAYEDPLQAPSYSYRMAVNFAPTHYQHDIIKLKTPTLVLVGNADESFYPERFQEVFEPAAAFTRVQRIPKANHLNIIKNEEVLTQIRELLLEE
ncbi:alpha/beta hydrolase [Leeuwenhoekiella palythoae]|uniref:Alpha-beta hydrolase superfamily lysophospholipase n=1 Tax=Leeuwenhoekiella palythoae TaxID=573501 RepID=A0A1M5XYF9_9FLAO|nr:alpha/beta hydrolase [Leeuwenhoekiella palythoae]RXG30331.1 alpha-beta hydrolase superfamily lysophospholipase [Leeuwenhoekiella palythoae]SHI04614.1 Lysophospholipase, alpha-beta hydrolase superfamily [Leeuwenhoekiella palythoae]